MIVRRATRTKRLHFGTLPLLAVKQFCVAFETFDPETYTGGFVLHRIDCARMVRSSELGGQQLAFGP